MNYRSRYIIATLLLLATPAVMFSQPYGNEWIHYNQQYFKIKTAENGIYHLTYNDLQAAGFPLSSVDPRKIQIFHRGKEQAIRVTGELDASFDSGDFIEFYGTRNDGSLDERLYRSSDAQMDPYYNLFSDTVSYFLTWRLDNGNGKRITTFSENNISGIPAENYYFARKILLFHSEYAPGLEYPNGSASAETYSAGYDYGEGWSGPPIAKGSSSDFILDSLGTLYTSGPPPAISIQLTGRNNLPHQAEILAGPSSSSLRSLATINFNYDSAYLFQAPLLFSDFGTSGTMTVRVHVVGADPARPDFISVTYIKLDYPHIPELDDPAAQVIRLRENPSGKSYIDLSNAGNPARLWDITDPDQVINIGFNNSGGNMNAVIDGTASATDLLIWGNTYLTPVIGKMQFRSFNASAPEYVIISNRKLMQPSSQYPDPVHAYAAYRASSQGGGYDTLVMEIGDLYNLFSYGETTPLAVKNFCSYLLNSGNPKFLLLIGKAVSVGFNYYRRPAGSLNFDDLVPTFGYPGSDIVFSAGYGLTPYEPGIPTGRIPAKSPDEVEAYLNKVKENDAFSYDQMWKKDIVHLSGGASIDELALFKNFVNDLKAVAEGKYLGGRVTTVSKQTDNSVENINISAEVNKGKSLITFFGHSAPSVTDIDIGFVSDPAEGYNNKGKYPLIFVNGCDAGDIFNISYLTFGEDWIVTPDKGAVGFIALSGTGYPPQLKRYSDNFYATAFTDTLFMNQPIGNILRKTDQSYLQAYTPGAIEIAQVQQSVLQGDPATTLFAAGRPDYAVDDNDVFISSVNQRPVTALSDSFGISVIVKNYGRADDSMFYVTVDRILPDGSVIHYDPVRFNPVYYSDTLHFIIDNVNIDAYGLNRFNITIDPFGKIKELSKLNNMASYQYFLSKSGTQNLVPFPYAIVPADSVNLIAQATDPLSLARDITFQIDTVPWFTSPVMTQLELNAKVVAEQPVGLFDKFPAADTTVFFWRTRYRDIGTGENAGWSGSSFCYIPSCPEGWIQADPYQIRQNAVTGMTYDSLSRQWEFQHNHTALKVTTYGYQNPDYDFNNVTLSLNGQPYIYSTRLCTGNSINALAFDYSSTQPYLVLSFGTYDILDRRSCGRQPQVINNFLNSEITGTQDYLTQYIDNVKAGDYVLLFSIDSVAYQSWPATLKSKVSEIGVSISALDSLKNGEPVIIIGRKGSAPGTAVMVKADPGLSIPATEQQIDLDYDITGSYTSGTLVSGIIGPARTWHRFNFNIKSPNAPDESFSFDIREIDKQGNESTLVTGVQTPRILEIINASQYPYLRLIFHTANTVSLTPAQLLNWMVTFDGMPEGILLPGDNLQLSGISKQEGEKFESGFIFRNLSSGSFSDSIRVDYTVKNSDLNKSVKDHIFIGSLNGGASENFSIPIHTLGLGGKNDLTVYANPKIIPEKYYNNNIINLPDHFTVNVDRTHPLLDVTVDGRYILDGEIVSPRPAIRIRIKDENKILLKTNPDGISIRIKADCDTCTFRQVPLNSNRVQWTPATPDRDFTIDYNPKKFSDGIYTLQVQATDASGNAAGTEPYSIRFEVINESRISNFYPYPNPFSSSVRFIFTLTGSNIPDQIKIQIMTVSGRVVREITQDEIGSVHIGNNITEYAWDGRDEYGDQLANGVYLYRVIVRRNGQSIPLRETAGDKAFTQGFGKLYLLR